MGKAKEAGNLTNKKGPKGKDRAVNVVRTGFDGPLQAPSRKTVSIFKQPVTLVHTTRRETKTTTPEQLRRGTRGARSKAEKPHQLFWAKSLEGMRAMVPVNIYDRLCPENNEHISQSLNLAGKMEPALSLLGNDASAATICSSIHSQQATDALLRNPITGQSSTKKQLDANPAVNANVEQPFVQAVTVSDQDVQMQERRVLDLRKRLQEARRHFHV